MQIGSVCMGDGENVAESGGMFLLYHVLKEQTYCNEHYRSDGHWAV